ncbi:tyrosine-type recombinase/integrase [Lachnospiraceae bacterium WCA-9-b2]|uniref:Tyrosine-type recombinase/integrase n=1 Tax=Sporofaciens musculi TaxID=2681861 RepID=A0A7X3MLY7_9FIRM|nr:site-specific integrase [Sporofaciens musculi]MCI9422523.1 site-specific integrase [Dorea sp.]MXP78677.1 tyrosine-type recombinase/integrase [Sporofaciens musculi]
MRKNQKLETIVPQWLENSKMRVKESTYVKYVNLTSNHILPLLGDIEAECLTTDTIEQFVQGRLNSGNKQGKGLAEKTVKDLLLVLKDICRYAALSDIDIPCRFELIRIRGNDSEIQVLDKHTQLRLERFLMRDVYNLKKTGILLSLCMGLRLGEICALRKGQILYKDGILQVRSTMQRIQNFNDEVDWKGRENRKTRVIITSPKSACSVRDIPMPEFMVERLMRLKTSDDNVFVLTGTSKKFVEPRTFENVFKRYLMECNMDIVNFHALRHTFATRCIEKGFDVKTLSEILGHANVNITLNRYVHSSMEQKRKWMSEMTLGVMY